VPTVVEHFETEHGYDYVTLNGQHYSGQDKSDGPEGIVPNDGTLTWTSDSSNEYSGWRLCWPHPMPPPVSPAPPPHPRPPPPLHASISCCSRPRLTLDQNVARSMQLNHSLPAILSLTAYSLSLDGMQEYGAVAYHANGSDAHLHAYLWYLPPAPGAEAFFCGRPVEWVLASVPHEGHTEGKDIVAASYSGGAGRAHCFDELQWFAPVAGGSCNQLPGVWQCDDVDAPPPNPPTAPPPPNPPTSPPPLLSSPLSPEAIGLIVVSCLVSLSIFLLAAAYARKTCRPSG